MRPDMDILVVLGIVEAERVRDIWNVVGFSIAALFAAIALGIFFHRFRYPILNVLSFLAKPRNFVVTACATAAVIYGSNKATVVTPQTHAASFEQTGSSVVEPVAGTVEYWQSSATTNGIAVALFGGMVTNEFDFLENQFIYAYDAFKSTGSYQNPTNNPLWCRHNTYSNWVQSTLATSWSPNSSNVAVIATLPGGKSPSFYDLWFIGPSENLPPIVVEVMGGIDITLTVVTSSSVTMYFTGTDPRFALGSHTYYMQSRVNIDGALTEWQTVASVTLSGGQTSGSVSVSGFTVDKYREYRIFSDLEVAE